MFGLLWLLGCAVQAPLPTEDEIREELETEVEPARKLMLLESNVSTHPDSENAHLWLARAYRERGDERAAASYAEAIRLAPTDPIPAIELAYLPLNPTLRRGATPDLAQIDAAEAVLAPYAGANADCETRHALIGLFELELELKHQDPDTAAYVDAAIHACPAPWPGRWWTTAARLRELSADPAGAKAAWCEAVSAGNAEAQPGCDGKPKTP